MPKCPSGTRRCPPKTGKCYKTAKKSAKKTAKKMPKLEIEDYEMHKKHTWVEHLKWCTKHFNIKYGKAMTDERCRQLWKDTR